MLRNEWYSYDLRLYNNSLHNLNNDNNGFDMTDGVLIHIDPSLVKICILCAYLWYFMFVCVVFFVFCVVLDCFVFEFSRVAFIGCGLKRIGASNVAFAKIVDSSMALKDWTYFQALMFVAVYFNVRYLFL